MQSIAVLGALAALALAVGAAGGAPANDGLLVFASNRAENLFSEIYGVNADGSGRRNLSRDLHADDSVQVSPRGDAIAFVSDRTGFPAVYVAQPDGSRLRRLTTRLGRGSDLRLSELAWSPTGGRLLVHATWVRRSRYESGLYVVGLRGGRARRVVNEDFLQAAWSPDGSRIAYGAGRGPATPLDDVVRVIDRSGRRLWTRPGASPLWSAGQRLALSSRPRRGGVRIYDADGRLLARFPGEARAWSPDGSRIAFARHRSLYVADADGRNARRVLARFRAFSKVEWSPDGRRLAAPLVDALQIVDLRGGAPRGLQGFAFGAWSPDGESIAANSAGGLFVARRSSGWRPRRVVRDPVDAVHWLRDGKRLIYASSARDNDHELFTLRPDGGALRALTRNRAVEIDPAWSPDGTRIAYSRAEQAGLACKGCAVHIYVMGANGSRPTRLAQHPHGIYDHSPDWSPDGARIAFARSSPTNSGQIFVMNADGSGLVNLTPGAQGTDPVWLPNGTQIAFVSSRGGGGIFVMNADGSAVTRLPALPRGVPAWSPDGRRIAFAGGDGLYVMEADGRGAARILRRRGVSGVSWSPDGSRIAFESPCLDCEASGRTADVYVVGADGSRPTRLTSNPADDSAPDWRP